MGFWKSFKKVIAFPFNQASKSLEEAPNNWETHYQNLSETVKKIKEDIKDKKRRKKEN